MIGAAVEGRAVMGKPFFEPEVASCRERRLDSYGSQISIPG